MKIIFKLALSIWVAFMLSGCERPPIETVQTGYRGTGMEQIYNPRTLIKQASLNQAPAAPDAASADGPKAGKAYQNVKVLGDLEACRRVAWENMQDAAQQGLDYVELRFSPFYMAMSHQLPLASVVEAVIDGVQQGSRDFDLPAKLIGIMSRTFGQAHCQQELDALLTHRDQITALDLAGDELGFPGELFIDHFKQARDAGWHISIHAGEAAGASSIWQAIQTLGATRIGHGVKAVEDAKLLDYLVEYQCLQPQGRHC